MNIISDSKCCSKVWSQAWIKTLQQSLSWWASFTR